MSMHNRQNINHDQSGFASLVIALVLIMVLSLITIGFAQLARREQQTALKNQLSNQAFYAAESGVNDAIKALPYLRSSGYADTNDCINPALLSPSHADTDFNKINTDTGIEYSCAIVNLKNPTLAETNTPANVTRSIIFRTTGPLNSITVNWGSSSSTKTPRATNPASCSPNTLSGGCFPPITGWGNSPPVAVVSLTPLSSLTRTSMEAKAFTAYLYPSASHTDIGAACPPGYVTKGSCVTYNPAPGGQAPIVSGNCSATGTCAVTISGIGGTVADQPYLIRMMALYDTADFLVDDAKTIGGTTLDYVGQPQIDVTGKARTVVKRLQVRINETANVYGPGTPATIPNYSIEAGDLCKRPQTDPTITNYITVTGGLASGSDPCNLAS